MTFCTGLQELNIEGIKCVEHDDAVCNAVLDLQTRQVVKFLSFRPGLEELEVRDVKCAEHDDAVCILVLDLQKHNNLKQLILKNISVEGLLLPVGEASITLLWLHNFTIIHYSLEQVVKFVTFCPGLEKLDNGEVKCVEHDDTVCIPLLDLRKLKNLKQLILKNISIESLLLPEGEATITLLWLHNLTITHHSLEQVVKFVSFCPGLEELNVREQNVLNMMILDVFLFWIHRNLTT